MKIVLSFLLATLIGGFTFAASLSIEGTYQGKNLYVQNPMDDDGFGYCATKVTVNGDIMPGGTNMGAFEIDFAAFGPIPCSLRSRSLSPVRNLKPYLVMLTATNVL